MSKNTLNNYYTQNTYLPEGLHNAETETYGMPLTEAELEHAMLAGKILEAPVIICDSEMRLCVDLGCMYGYIPREDTVLTPEGEAVKDIAVITRVGKSVCFKVLELYTDGSGNRCALLSRREAQLECREHYLSELKVGDIIPAKITHLEHFGAFVDVGCGIISLLSIDCISVSRISHPRDRFAVGTYIKCAVKSIERGPDQEIRRIYVTHRELLGTWEENISGFSIGMTVAGIVRSIEEYGIFVELAPNLAGLAEYRSDISVGQTAAVYIKNIIPERMKIKLVLIDSYRGELIPQKTKYYTGEQTHIDRWLYSPEGSSKIIETVFE